MHSKNGNSSIKNHKIKYLVACLKVSVQVFKFSALALVSLPQQSWEFGVPNQSQTTQRDLFGNTGGVLWGYKLIIAKLSGELPVILRHREPSVLKQQ